MIPIWRNQKKGPSSLDPMSNAPNSGRVITLFPERTRGLPEQPNTLKKGIARLGLRDPQVSIVPIHLRGLGKSLPRGEMIFIPLIPHTSMGESILCKGKTEASWSLATSMMME
jgi:1-acyl-sn-glycerol-3-phosphate acyltransferase